MDFQNNALFQSFGISCLPLKPLALLQPLLAHSSAREASNIDERGTSALSTTLSTSKGKAAHYFSTSTDSV